MGDEVNIQPTGTSSCLSGGGQEEKACGEAQHTPDDLSPLQASRATCPRSRERTTGQMTGDRGSGMEPGPCTPGFDALDRISAVVIIAGKGELLSVRRLPA
ncbi:hypothetical protein SRHO_G00118250 [Serrasalmus rhombeus]